MAQSFDVSGSKGGSRSFGRRPIVLARLPRVATGARTIAMTPPHSQATTFAEATRFYVDPHHATAIAQAKEAEQPADHSAADAQRRHGAHRHSPRPPQPAIAASLPVKLASYSGVVTTLMLAASVALLYWMIIAPSQTPPADFANSFDTIGATKIEIPYFEVAAPPPGPPQAAAPVKVPVASIDPFLKEDDRAAEGAAPAAAESPVAQPAPTLTAAAPPIVDNQAAADAPTPPAQPATDLVPLPEIIPTPTTTPQVIYNDSSAAAYPTTDHPLASHITVLGISALGSLEPAPPNAGPSDGAKFFSVPQVSRQPDSNLIQR